MQKEVKDHILGIIEKSQEDSTKWIKELDPNKSYSKEAKTILAFTCGFNTYAQALSDIKYFINNNFPD